MSESKNVPSVEIILGQQSAEVVPSVAIERIISLRDEGIRLYRKRRLSTVWQILIFLRG